MEFWVNGFSWIIEFVPADAPILWVGDHYTLGVTDLRNQIVYLSDQLYGDKLYDVWIHELCHCFFYSYGFSLPVDSEECYCQLMEAYGNYIKDFGNAIFFRINH